MTSLNIDSLHDELEAIHKKITDIGNDIGNLRKAVYDERDKFHKGEIAALRSELFVKNQLISALENKLKNPYG